MEQEYEYLLELMGCSLTGRPPRPRRDTDWQKLMDLADIHSVSGILAYANSQHRLCTDPELAGALRRNLLATLSVFARRAECFSRFSRRLREAGITHILMKGAVLRDYYPVPELRTFNDFDIVIRPEDRERCHALMLEAGYTPAVDWGPVYSYHREQVLYEIHTDIMEADVSDRADYRGYFAGMWQHTVAREEHCLEFTPEYHFLYLLTHIAKHISGSGAGARMYLDLGAFILHFGGRVDWAWIEGELKKIKLWQFARVAFTAVERWFGIASPLSFEAAPDDVMAEFLAYTMEAGPFGHFQREDTMANLKKNGEPGFLSRWKLLLERTFPAAETIRARYTYLQKMPWLLPVAWIHRLIITRGGFGRHAHEAQVILNTDAEQISRLSRLMRDIGL